MAKKTRTKGRRLVLGSRRVKRMFLTWIGLSFDAGYVESCVVNILPVKSKYSENYGYLNKFSGKIDRLLFVSLHLKGPKSEILSECKYCAVRFE